jgi:hypothetical protein
MKLAEIINQYIGGVQEYGVNWAPAGGVPLLFRAIVYAAPPSEVLEGEEDLAYSVIDLFIENGFDVNKKFGLNQKTAVELARSLGKFDGDRCYEYLSNIAFDQPISVTEATDDYEWFRNAAKAVKNTKVAKGLGDALKKVANNPPHSVLGKLQNKIAEKIVGMDNVKKRFEAGNYNLDREGNDKGAQNAGKNLDELRTRVKSPVKKNSEFSTLPDSEKVSYCYMNITGPLSEDSGDNTKLKEALARKMAKTNSPFTSEVYKATEAIKTYLGQTQTPDKGIYVMVISEKYPEINELAAKGGLTGLEKNGKKFSEQIKYLAYFSQRGYDLDFLKKEGKWLSAKEMKNKINSLELTQRRIPKEKDLLDNETRKKYEGAIKDLGIKDPKTINSLLAKANVIKEDDDTIAMGKILKAYGQMKGYNK